MTVEAALQHPVVARHPAVKSLAKEQARLAKAKQAQLERTRKADAAYQQALVAWQAEHDQAVLDGREHLPPKPQGPAGTNAQALLVNEGERLRQDAQTLLADLAPQLVLKLAAYLDDQLAAVRQGPVGAVPDALSAVNASRSAVWTVARSRWSPVQLPKPPEPIGVGELVVLALGPPGGYSDQWGGIVEADRRRAEDEARQAAEMAQLRDKAVEVPGRMVIGGPGTFGQPDVPPVDTRLAGRR